MMSDTALKGRVIWFLMTARIHRLSPDIRRPGRMDLIIPILDPDWDDRDAFFKWTFQGIDTSQGGGTELHEATKGYSAAAFATLRSQIKAKGINTVEAALALSQDMVLPDIEDVRTFQTLQAKLNCTRKSLLFDPRDIGFLRFEEQRREWKDQLRALETKGIS
jgi:SpoVK/Ycf46/Vps4 family AAA+-type ATPase